MGYYAKVGIGLALMLGGIGAFALSIVEFVDIGTCASGGPFESVQECPEGVEKWVGVSFGSVIAFIIGIAVFAARGGRSTAPGLPSAEARATPDWSSLGSPTPPKSGSAPASVPTVFTNREAANARAVQVSAQAPPTAAVPPPPTTSAPAPSAAAAADLAAQAGDPVKRLEELNQLREKGAISEAEFTEAKTRILRDF